MPNSLSWAFFLILPKKLIWLFYDIFSQIKWR